MLCQVEVMGKIQQRADEQPLLRRRSLLAAGGAGAALLAMGPFWRSTAAFAAPAWRYPFTARHGISSRFGSRPSPGHGGSTNHQGLDIAAPNLTPIFAVASGTVTVASFSGGYGNLVEIDHGDGWRTRYGHMADGTMNAAVGQRVSLGTFIGKVGSTGNSTGPHLHLELRQNGTPIDPAPAFENAALNPGSPVGDDNDNDDDEEGTMIRLTHVPNSTPGGPDEYIVIDHGQHTYWGVPDTQMLGFLRAQGIKEIKDKQGRQFIAGYRRIS
ncbi:hypothetical protein DEI91_14620 [Curtobacterium sp. MCBD17_032]|nr:hypothetical protein DEI91_14620 [Curtobacterium sp. MCBD17_032]